MENFRLRYKWFLDGLKNLKVDFQNLQKRLLALEEMKSGSDPLDIKLAQENLEKNKSMIKHGTVSASKVQTV